MYVSVIMDNQFHAFDLHPNLEPSNRVGLEASEGAIVPRVLEQNLELNNASSLVNIEATHIDFNLSLGLGIYGDDNPNTYHSSLWAFYGFLH
jgi:hypothetical protein